MAGRLALIIGSECEALPELGFVAALATDLCDKLVRRGDWGIAVGGDRPLLDPTAAELKTAIRVAFAAAHDARATLLIAFIGHGVTTASQDFHLMAFDSPADPDSETAYHLTQGIRERLNMAPSVDGLVVLVDACEAGEGVSGAADRWVDVLGKASGRMELLVASGVGSAYDGCFTRTLTGVIDSGVESGGEYLLCRDLQPFVAQCPAQEARYLAFNGGWIAVGDPGLWLVPNVARRRDAVRGRASAGLVDLLARGVVITDALRQQLADLVDHDRGSRLRAVVGPSGCGKSTLMAMLIRPSLVDTLNISADYIAAAAFLDATSTLESLTAEWVAQLALRVPGFEDARSAVAAELTGDEIDSTASFELEIIRPLRRVRRAGHRVRLLVDGLDQPDDGNRDQLLSAISSLTCCDDGLEQVRVIVAVRSGSGLETRPEMNEALWIELAYPDMADLCESVPEQWAKLVADHGETNGWLIVRLIGETYPRTLEGEPRPLEADLEALVDARFKDAIDRTADSDALVAMVNLLVAAGVGPVLPLSVVTEAMRHLGHSRPVAQVRDLVSALGSLLCRGKPGLADESLGIAHAEVIGPLEISLCRYSLDRVMAHRAILLALEEFTVGGEASEPVVAYARSTAARHHLALGDSSAALAVLVATPTARAADNRNRFARWIPSFEECVGPDHPATLTMRDRLAFWRGLSGNLSGALDELALLLVDRTRVLGAKHPDTLATRGQLAITRGQTGDVSQAVAELESLLYDQTRVLGDSHPSTLTTRNNLATMHGDSGDVARAIAELELLLSDGIRVLGADHPDTLVTRSNLANWRGHSGDVAGTIVEYEVLLSEQLRTLSADDPDIFITRSNLATWRGESGDIDGAVAELSSLLADQLRVLGADHPNTLATRNNLASTRGESGDIAGAIADYESLLADRTKVLGGDHPDTLTVRNNLAHWRGESGDVLGVVTELELLLADRSRVLGSDHPQTLTVRNNLASWRGELGDAAGAVTDLQGVLADQLRVLGADHPHTLMTRNNLAFWRSESGDAAGAMTELRALLVNQSTVMGASHPSTLTTRDNLALLLVRSGNAVEAVVELESLLEDRIRVLGSDHPDALATRDNLARLRNEI